MEAIPHQPSSALLLVLLQPLKRRVLNRLELSIQETGICFTYNHNVVSLLFNSFLLLKLGEVLFCS